MEDNVTPSPLQQMPEDPENQPVQAVQEDLGAAPQDLFTEPAEEEDETTAAPGRSKKWFFIGGLLVIFLAAAVFLGARLIKPPNAAESPDGGGMFISKGGPGGAQKGVRLDMTSAKELPQDKPTASGVFVRREDQSIFIGTGNIRIMAKKANGSSAAPDVSSSYDGPVVEVVINHQTKVYQDITELPEPDTAKDGVVTAQQEVKPGSIDDISSNSQVTAWGEKQGDRYIASVIVFR